VTVTCVASASSLASAASARLRVASCFERSAALRYEELSASIIFTQFGCGGIVFETADDLGEVVGGALVHFDEPQLSALLCSFDDAAGQLELLTMLR
jgi:hypothetical protein